MLSARPCAGLVQLPDMARIDRLKIFLDSMGGGAWPFLVGGVICLVNSVNERDLDLLNSLANSSGFEQTS